MLKVVSVPKCKVRQGKQQLSATRAKKKIYLLGEQGDRYITMANHACGFDNILLQLAQLMIELRRY
jgi:hypothetical protein